MKKYRKWKKNAVTGQNHFSLWQVKVIACKINLRMTPMNKQFYAHVKTCND